MRVGADGSLSLTVLGCSGTYAGAGDACSGYLVRHRGAAVMLDAGPGTLARLQEHIGIDGLRALVLSHVHPDHWLDVPILRNVLAYVTQTSGLAVYAPAEVGEMADHLFEGRHTTFDWTDVTAGDEVQIDSLRLTFSRTDHPPETLAVRVAASDRALGYSADTGPGWSMAEFGEPVDLALWEATFCGQAPEGAHHSSAADTGRLAAESGVGRLVLTHLLPGTDAAQSQREAAEAFGGPVEVARPGATFVA